MCKRVEIKLEGGATVELFQKEFSIIQNPNTKTYKPGQYPEPCRMMSDLPNVEIFHVGLFLIARIYEKNNPFFVKFEVRGWFFRKKVILCSFCWREVWSLGFSQLVWSCYGDKIETNISQFLSISQFPLVFLPLLCCLNLSWTKIICLFWVFFKAKTHVHSSFSCVKNM